MKNSPLEILHGIKGENALLDELRLKLEKKINQLNK
jgi:hypothetical protein